MTVQCIGSSVIGRSALALQQMQTRSKEGVQKVVTIYHLSVGAQQQQPYHAVK